MLCALWQHLVFFYYFLYQSNGCGAPNSAVVILPDCIAGKMVVRQSEAWDRTETVVGQEGRSDRLALAPCPT